jgi:hypothetical protein
VAMEFGVRDLGHGSAPLEAADGGWSS